MSFYPCPTVIAKPSSYASLYKNESGYPNQAYLIPEKHQFFKQIVLGGALKAGGMASFADILTDADAEAIQAFIISRQQELRKQEPTSKK